MNRLAIGIVRSDHAARLAGSLPGFDHDVCRLVVDGIAVIYVGMQSRQPATIPRLLAYARLVEALHRQGPVLPLRYGAWFETEGDLTQLLERRHDRFRRALATVDGADEMGLSVRLPSEVRRPVEPVDLPPLPDVSPGRLYLDRLRCRLDAHEAQRARVEGLVRSIQAALSAFSIRVHAPAAPPRGAPDRLSLAFLVRRADVPGFRATAGALERSGRDEICVTGPWPPYHFVDLAEHTP